MDIKISKISEPCPRCGRQAVGHPGALRILNETVEVINASETTVEQLRLLGLLANDVVAGKVSAKAAVAAAESIKPGSGEAFGKWIKDNAVGIAALALSGAVWVQQSQGEADRTKQVERLIEAVEKLPATIADQASDRGADQKSKAENRKTRRSAEARNHRTKKAH